jgi:MFS family permease
MAHDVFISYSHLDKPTADAACATLESRGIRCWIAPRDVLPGDEYASALVNAIHASRMLVLVFSSGANQSPQVLREVERAVSKGLPILPLRIEDVAPSAAMEYYISSRHWLDALTTPLEQHLVQLADTVTLLLARSPGGSPPAPPPGAVRPVPPPIDEARTAPPPRPEPVVEPPPAARPAPAPQAQAPAPARPAAPVDPVLAGRNRVAIAGLVIISLLGASGRVWSRLLYMFGWTSLQATILPSLRLLLLAAGFVAGGLWLRNYLPRRIATVAGALYGLGVLGAGIFIPQSGPGFLVYLFLVCLSAFGSGLGFVVAMVTMLSWFPGRRGTIAGLAIAALTLSSLPGELLMSYIGLRAFVLLGLPALVGIALAARALHWPPETLAAHAGAPAPAGPSRAVLWTLLFLNTLTGALAAGSLLAGVRSGELLRTRYDFLFAIAVGLGAVVLGGLSDRRGRRRVLLPALGTQVVVLVAAALMPGATIPLLLVLMLCNGAGWSITAAIAADGAPGDAMRSVLGPLLTAWSLAFLAAGALGSLAGSRGLPFLAGAALPLVAAIIVFRMRPPPAPGSASS